MITAADYVENKVTGFFNPREKLGMYPGERSDGWSLPEDIQNEYHKLNSMIESKYHREYLKICAFYNKMFPSLRTSSYITSTYNVPAFTAIDQERQDTGTGMTSNYLKQIVDQVVSRLGTVTFEPAIVADVPTLEYLIYKDEVERLLRKEVRDSKLNRLKLEVFHDAAIVGFSHVFIDPVTHELVKANDYEVGLFESQFTADDIKHMLYRNYRFPVVSLVPYLKYAKPDLLKSTIDDAGGKDFVDFKLFFDCPGKKAVITIGGKTLDYVPYPFEKVQMVTFCWDAGFSKVTATSLFDLLYPTQREINYVTDKIHQLIRVYKGAVPVFNSDVDLAMKNISNGTGEVLYVDSSRPIDSLMTVINPTPLDAALTAEKNQLKTEMYELSGAQNISFNVENIRSAATLIALDQTKDIVFQAQLSGIGDFITEIFRMRVRYNTVIQKDAELPVMWQDVDTLLNDAYVDLKPVTVTNPLGNKGQSDTSEPDYRAMLSARIVILVARGQMTYDSLDFTIDKAEVEKAVAYTAVKMGALGIVVPDTIYMFLISAFIEDMKQGLIEL